VVSCVGKFSTQYLPTFGVQMKSSCGVFSVKMRSVSTGYEASLDVVANKEIPMSPGIEPQDPRHATLSVNLMFF